MGKFVKKMMLRDTLNFVRDSLSRYLTLKFDLMEPKVVVNRVLDKEGMPHELNMNKVVISLLHMDLEREQKTARQDAPQASGESPPSQLYQNARLNLLVSSSFSNYDESLKFLEAALQFFHSYSSKSQGSLSSLPEGINKVEFEVERSGYFKIQLIWGGMNTQYQPSFLLNVRVEAVKEDGAGGFY